MSTNPKLFDVWEYLKQLNAERAAKPNPLLPMRSTTIPLAPSTERPSSDKKETQ